MHLTMVQKPCEMIKEKTMWNLSTEDQKVIEAILLAIVNDDQLTRGRLIDVLQDIQGTVCSILNFSMSQIKILFFILDSLLFCYQ